MEYSNSILKISSNEYSLLYNLYLNELSNFTNAYPYGEVLLKIYDELNPSNIKDIKIKNIILEEDTSDETIDRAFLQSLKEEWSKMLLLNEVQKNPKEYLLKFHRKKFLMLFLLSLISIGVIIGNNIFHFDENLTKFGFVALFILVIDMYLVYSKINSILQINTQSAGEKE